MAQEETEYQSFSFPMAFKGVNQRVDVSLLAPGEFESAVNVTSLAEGSISSRQGRRGKGATTGFVNPHTIARLRLSSTQALNYVGETEFILRSSTDYTGFTLVASGVVLPTEAVEHRFGWATHPAGTRGDPYIYFAGREAMLKDYGAAPYASLRPWGIKPAPAAASAILSTPFTTTINASPSVLVPASTVAYEDMVIYGGGALDLGAFQSPTVKASGVITDGFDSDDYIEIHLQITDVSLIEDLRLQFDVGLTVGESTDYYEKALAISKLTPGVTRTELIEDSLVTRDPYLESLALGPLEAIDEALRTASPYELQPAYQPLDEVIKIPKKDFLKVGVAGAKDVSFNNWKLIRRVRLRVKSSALGATVTVVSARMVGGSGPNSEVDATTNPYDYVYTHRDPLTGNEGNPSPAMLASKQIRSERTPIDVTVWGTSDLNIPVGTANTIAIYRRGGIFIDGLFRFVGYATNPGESGGVPLSVNFLDGSADADIAGNRTVEFDNDPPVSSPLPQPFRSTLIAGFPVGWATVLTGSPIQNVLTPGTKLSLISTTDPTVNEDVVIYSITGSNSALVYCQNAHAGGEAVNADFNVGFPAGAVCWAGDSLFVAGDKNNPHLLYQSKTGRTDAFPFSKVNRVGSPSNPIMAITAMPGGDAIVCLNMNHLYLVPLWLGQMQNPVETAAQRGLFSRYAWCVGDDGIYYLGYDGVYVWAGGGSRKISEKIDYMFKNRVVNGIAPVDMGQVNPPYRHQITFEFHRNTLYISFWDTFGNTRRMRYYVPGDRWEIEDVPSNRAYSEKDTGRLILCRFDPVGGIISEDDVEGTTGTSDDFLDASGEGGTAIPFTCKTGFFSPMGPAVQKLFGDIVLEITNPGTAVTVNVYFDFAATPDVNSTFTLPASAGSHRLVALPLNQSGGVTFGKEARAVAFEFSGSGTKRTEIHSVTFNVVPLATLQRGRVGEWTEAGHPYDKRFYEISFDYDTGGQAVNFYLDTVTGIEAAQVENLTVAVFPVGGTGRGRPTLRFPDGIIAKKVRIRPTVPASEFKFFQYHFVAENYPPDVIPFTPWSDYNHPNEKHLQVLHLDVDTNNQAVTVALEGDGAVQQTFTVQTTEQTRRTHVALTNAIVVKQARLKVTNIPAGGKFQLHSHNFDKIDYPAPTILFTEYSHYGYELEKFLQQLLIEVNTNNQIVPVSIEGDGAILQTVNIQTTLNDRHRSITLNPQLQARRMRLTVNPSLIPAGGRFQLFWHDIVYLPADKGKVRHSFDFDDLGWPYDKRLKTVTLEYDTGGLTTNMLLDVLSGINGSTETPAIQSFPLSGPGRALQTYGINDGTIVKMVRFRPQSIPSTLFKHWRYVFDFEKLPADIIYFTEWVDSGHRCGKVVRSVVVDIDTGGVACTVNVQGDGITLATASLTTSANDRVRVITVTNETPVKLIRLTFTPGSGGKSQVYRWEPDVVREPCEVTRWSSLPWSFSWPHYSFVKQCWVQYKAPSGLTFSIYRDNDVLFHQETLPAQTTAEVQRFFLPARTGTALNKSKRHRFTLTSAAGFQFWEEGSRVEAILFGVDIRKAVTQVPMSHMTKPQTGV